MTNAIRPDFIQNFNLFGESDEMPDVVHCESIAARSTLHNWEFTPHRHRRLHQVLLVKKGGGEAVIEGQKLPLSEGVFVNVPLGCVHAFSFQPETEGWVVTMVEEVLDQAFVASEGVQQVFGRAGIYQATPAISDAIKAISRDHIHMEFARAHVLRALTAQLIGLVARVISDVSEPGDLMPQTPLKQRFESLVDARYKNHWPVARYAAALAVTPGHLSRIMRQTSGMSASQIIVGRIIREARRSLIYTNLSISEIAYDLGFNDPAYFSRVFTQATGHSPRKFRARLEKPNR